MRLPYWVGAVGGFVFTIWFTYFVIKLVIRIAKAFIEGLKG